MQLTILSRKTLSEIPSASGIEITGDKIYILGDDSPWLFQLNRKFEVTEKIPIGDESAAVKGKIPKSLKPDLEAMAAYGNELLLFGSGSRSPQRDVLVRVNTVSKKVNIYSLVEFYNRLCSAADLTRDELNLEAAAIIGEHIFLFNRGKNVVFKLIVRELLSHAEGKNKIPEAGLFHASLPSLNGIEAGFSGAATTPDGKRIIFTASIENTPNWIDDGEILGSFVGVFSPDELKGSFTPECVPAIDSERNVLKIKVESVAVREKISENSFRLLLVTDNDSSSSEILEAGLAL